MGKRRVLRDDGDMPYKDVFMGRVSCLVFFFSV
jgi:hypothetical protein